MGKQLLFCKIERKITYGKWVNEENPWGSNLEFFPKKFNFYQISMSTQIWNQDSSNPILLVAIEQDVCKLSIFFSWFWFLLVITKNLVVDLLNTHCPLYDVNIKLLFGLRAMKRRFVAFIFKICTRQQLNIQLILLPNEQVFLMDRCEFRYHNGPTIPHKRIFQHVDVLYTSHLCANI